MSQPREARPSASTPASAGHAPRPAKLAVLGRGALEALLLIKMRLVERRAFIAGLLFAALVASSCASFWLLYPGMAESNDPHLDPKDAGYSYETVTVTNAQGHKLLGWLFSSPGDHGTALIAGGNAQSISSTYSVSRYLINNGFRVLIFTYQGFGDNGGHAELTSLIGDAQAFYAFAKHRDKSESIAFVGYSTGAVTGLCLGDREPLSAVVVEGTFNPKTIVEDKHLYIAMPLDPMFKSAVPDELDTSRCLQELKSVPVLFLHNHNDPLAPYDSARRLFDGYQGPKEFIDTREVSGPDAHYGSVSDPEARARVLAFLKHHLAS
jgi:pimeloyl-ACP methyl ester carboxylesterase